MFSVFLSACVLALLTVATQATGIAVLLRRFIRLHHLPTSWLMNADAAPLDLVAGLAPSGRDINMGLVLSVARMSDRLPDGVLFFWATYTTIGYGDVVLAKPWRLLGPIEGLMGVLMCGLSTGYFFVIVISIYQARSRKATAASGSEG